MKTSIRVKRLLLLLTFAFGYCVQSLHAQGGAYIGWSGDMKWLRINSLHAYFSEQGAEAETGGDNEWNNRFSWPGEYGIVQTTLRSNGMWLGCRNYYDAKVNQTFPYLVTNIGPKPGEYPDGRYPMPSSSN